MRNAYFVDPSSQTVTIYCRKRDGEFTEVLIDIEDLPIADAHPSFWSVADTSRNGCSYCCASAYGRTKYLHREIMHPEPGMVVDHLGGNDTTLDNRKANLEIVSPLENLRRGRLNHQHHKPSRHMTITKDGRYRATYGGSRRTFNSYDQACSWISKKRATV